MGESVATKREDVPMVLGFCSKEEGLYWGKRASSYGGSKSDTEICIYPLLLICLRYFNGLTRGAL